MPVSTSQQISRYYDQFSNIEVTFTKEVTQAILLYPKQVYLRCLGYQWPCIIYSSSLVGAKIITNITGSLNETVRKANNLVSLRFSFLQKDKPDPLSFFVSSKVTGYTPYGKNKPELSFMSLAYTQRPPDDLIEILGQLLEANVLSQKRKEERVVLTVQTAAIMGIDPKECRLTIDGVPRKCIVRDLSFGGAKVILMGLAKFLVNKTAELRLPLTEKQGALVVPGKVVRFDPVEGRSDIAAFALQYDEDKVPLDYKVRMNSLIRFNKSARKEPTQ
ncbi:MAG: PilZN3 domain-containing protein [Spirochaetaceae bacterium]